MYEIKKIEMEILVFLPCILYSFITPSEGGLIHCTPFRASSILLNT